MNIKVGDLVLYNGKIVRLLFYDYPKMRLTHFGIVKGSVYDLQLIKSTKLPTLTIGDLVSVNDIPQEDKESYAVFWSSKAEITVREQKLHRIEEIHPSYRFLVKVNNCWFISYHVTPVIDYDMV